MPNAKNGTQQELLTCDCDVLVPAALENQITTEIAEKLKAKIVLELANGPTTPEGDMVLHARKIKLIPNILTNTNNITTSYLEWVQNRKQEHWPEEQVFNELKPLMMKAAKEVMDMKTTKQCTSRQAAFLTAIERIRLA
jgi:glutamate dehydrogenase/leucine dehydrogenase